MKEKLDAIVKMYRYTRQAHECESLRATAIYDPLRQALFPYYVTAILGGLDEDGKGAVYSYDPVGSYEREQCRAAGAAASLIMPFLDNQVNFKNQYMPGSGEGHALLERERRHYLGVRLRIWSRMLLIVRLRDISRLETDFRC